MGRLWAITKIAFVVISVAFVITIFVLLFVDRSSDPIEIPTTPSTTTTEVPNPALYEVGVSIADMTGPCAEINFMGYGDLGQKGQGIHTRQYARSFIFVKGDKRVVLVIADVYAVGIAVRREVVRFLQGAFGNMYSFRNVIIMGTHTHSAPGGHLGDFFLDLSILGFSPETFTAYVNGILVSIVLAHFNTSPARLYYGETRVQNANMNRSPYSYEYNPPEEKARYDTNTDDTLSQVRIVRAIDGNLLGVLNWFPVHSTSMNMTNQLISSDNLGYAAMRMEKALNPGRPTGQPLIVAGFLASSLGDVSPNVRGARCEFSGDECDNQIQLCEDLEICSSLGPGDDMFQSTRIIGTAIYEGAMEVLNTPGEELRGEIGVIHQFVEMPEETVARYDPVERTFNTNEPVSGCVPSLGYSFALGTVDGANSLNVTQGTIYGNPLLDSLSEKVVAEPTEADVECHAPKPILLATGRANDPLPWHPRVVSVSLIWLADFVIAGVPGEPTTMTGRRIKDVVGRVMESNGFEPRVAVSGITNEYIHYVATYEEYQAQRYEAASTIYGPHTLDILLNKFSEFTTVAIEGGDVEPGPEPEDHLNRTVSVIPPIQLDAAPIGSSFGDVLEQPPAIVQRGDTVSATFVGANPRNDMRREATHAAVERLDLDQWVLLATDADWETKFYWERESTLTGTSRARFEWTVPLDAVQSSYRIVYYGAYRSASVTITQFTGTSDSFDII